MSSQNTAADATAPAPVPTDPAALEAAIGERQRALAATVDELVDRVHPRNVAQRTSAEAKVRVHEALYTPQGQLRTERVAAVGAAAAALLALLVWRKLR